MLNKQLESLTEYTNNRSGEETTLSVRTFAEKEIDRIDQTHVEDSKIKMTRLDSHSAQMKQLLAFTERVDKDLSNFKNYTDNMKLDKVLDLFQQAKEEDMINDNIQEYDQLKNYKKMLKFSKDDVLLFNNEDQEEE